MTRRLAVAIVGAGRMGAAMAARLRSAGADVVVYNRTPEKALNVAQATGARVARTAAEAVAAAPVVLVSLADDSAVTSAYQGESGIAAGVAAGTVVADTSTVDPRTVAAMAALLADRVGARMPQAATNSEAVAAALAAGLGDHDMSALAEALRRL